MTPLQVLEFFVRHTAFKSTKNISAIANTDPGNLHSCLAGKRALPVHIAQRVAAAVGLVASIEDGQLSLDVASGSIITLEVDTTELINLSGALASLAPETNYFWRLLVSQEEPVRKGVFAIAITSYKDSYFVINLSCESTDEAYRALEGELPDHLPGKRLPQEPDQFVYSTNNAT